MPVDQPKKKRIKVQSAKQKGRNLQKWLAGKIGEVTGFEVGKDTDIESRPMGQSGIDVRLSKAVLKRFPFSPECKAQEILRIGEWIEQAKANQLPKTDWLLCVKKNAMKPIIIIDGNVFFELIRKLLSK